MTPSAIVRNAAESAPVIHSSVVSASVDLDQRARGPARALMGSLRKGRLRQDESGGQGRARSEKRTDARSIGLLDGLATFIRLRLLSLSAGPDAMEVGVVFAEGISPLDGLPMAHPYPVAGGVARSGRDGVGVVCTSASSALKGIVGKRLTYRSADQGHT